MNILPSAYQGKKFFAPRQIFKYAGIRAGCCYGTLLLYTAHLHTKMTRLNDHDDPLRMECRLQALTYLRGESLLQLQAAGKGIDKPGQLTETGYATVGYIPNVGLPKER